MHIPVPALQKYSILAVIVLLSLIGSLAIAFSTRWGPWAYSDSTEYIVSARTFLSEGRLGFYAPSGTFKSLTLHPPLYSLILSAFGLIGIDLLIAARWLNVFLFGGTIFMTGALTWRLFRSSWMAILLSLTLLTLPTLVNVSSGAMTELLFFFTGGASILLMALYFEAPKMRWLILSAIATSLSFLSRYPGIALTITGLAGILLLNHFPWKRRIQDGLIYGSISLAPTCIWLVWVYRHTQTLSSHNFNFDINLWQALIPLRLSLVNLFWSWLPFLTNHVPYNYNLTRNILLVLGVLLTLAFVFTLAVLKREGRFTWPISPEFSFVFLWTTAALTYLALLSYSFLFTTPAPDVIPRTLLPLQYFLAFILLGLCLFIIRELRLPRWATLITVLLALPFLISNTLSSWSVIRNLYQQGAGYTARSWHDSDVMEVVPELPAEIPIITNEAFAFLLWTDRPAYDFCTLPCDQPENVRYGDNPDDEVQRIFREQGAALVLFYPFCASRDEPWNAERMAQLDDLTRGLTSVEYSCDGAIYYYPQR